MEPDNATVTTPDLGQPTLHVDAFLEDLRGTGYAPPALASRRSIITGFFRWTAAQGVGIRDLDEPHLAAFLKQRPPRADAQKERATLRRFLGHLRAQGVCAPPAPTPASPVDDLAQRYVAFLRTERGLAGNSILVYAPCARDFLRYRVAQAGSLALEALDAETVRTFLLERVAHRASESSRLLTVSLRSLLRYLFLRGHTPRDLSAAVPMVRQYRQAGVPAILSLEELERVLAAPDRSTPRGRRDAAILLLLARLGLRASEIVMLELGDLRWRAGEIVVRSKGPRVDHVPLLAEVGDAIAQYLRADRGTSGSRRVFLRLIPPRVGLSRPCAVDHIVRLAFARAGVRPRPGRVAHLFRHTLATRMIRRGASLAEIAEVLRHRSQTTTAIYAKVSFEALREVARPWPVAGDAP